MINRTLIRTRVMQTAHAHLHKASKSQETEVELQESLDRTYDLYLLLLRLLPALTQKFADIQEIRRRKYLASDGERKPNRRLANNRLSAMIEGSSTLEAWASAYNIRWEEEDELLLHLLKRIESSDVYTLYLESTDSFEEDKAFWVEAFRQIISTDEMLAEYLEDQSMYWDDERTCIEDIVCENAPNTEYPEEAIQEAKVHNNYSTQRLKVGVVEIVKDFVIKSLRKAEEDLPFDDFILPAFKDEEDKNFGKHLLRYVLLDFEKNQELLSSHISSKWDKERLASLDQLIIQMGIVEFLYFPGIPTMVTINECVELGKHYSTPKSASFINGVLDAISKSLKAQGRILKQ